MENQGPHDFEKIMEFILEQQAKFAVDIQQLRESQARLEAAQERTDGMVRNLVDVCMSLANHVEESDRRVDRFIAATEERSKEADQRLNALIDIVDKLVRRNGGE
jgi:hypothetical protein